MRCVPNLIRDASWREVTAVIDECDAVKNANGWADRYGVLPVNYPGCRVTLESWERSDIDALMIDLAGVEPRMVKDVVRGVNNATVPPRLNGLPLVLIKFGDVYGMLDGKHRANKWRHAEGRYAALVIHA